MRRALPQGYLRLATPGAGEVGCVIVRDGEVLAEAFNEGELRFDPTGHSEMVAIRNPLAKWKVNLRDATLYCTLQPCAMCTLGVSGLTAGKLSTEPARQPVNSIYFELRDFNTADLIYEAFKDDLQMMGGMLSQDLLGIALNENQPVPPHKAAHDVAHRSAHAFLSWCH